MIIKSRVIVPGQAEGAILKLGAPLSFWGGVSPVSAEIIQVDHPDQGTCISGTILALPGTIGSSSSSAVLLELLYKKIAPKAILMVEADAILTLGDLVAKEMGYPTIPILLTSIDQLKTGQTALIETDGKLTLKDG